MSDVKEFAGWVTAGFASIIAALNWVMNKKQSDVNIFKTQQEISANTIKEQKVKIDELKEDKTKYLELHEKDLQLIIDLQKSKDELHDMKLEYQMYKLKNPQ